MEDNILINDFCTLFHVSNLQFIILDQFNWMFEKNFKKSFLVT